MAQLPIKCPSCQDTLEVSELSCASCATKISGTYALPALMQLPVEDQEFILAFVITGGSLKKMASQLGKSYPTVRNKLDDIINQLNSK
ncbi:DUF2089 family protein [Mesonia aestuariivivens]|uniref:DUF2089 domain-containing protein n=1 Tax=Mesonia aestuariivivens TaxID=2796128 RepID=A0ABS6W2L9_9FLAO|nr:DUF2089 family protein [Mesonia aestuariivivens]MBW2962064.1 DUF2089 domain-containing protein [Mesonia aestuariivivens]